MPQMAQIHAIHAMRAESPSPVPPFACFFVTTQPTCHFERMREISIAERTRFLALLEMTPE
jgi:hypothetical protein